jgi:hypothetical protein
VASFGEELPIGGLQLSLVPIRQDACTKQSVADAIKDLKHTLDGKKVVALIPRGNCTFEQKVYNAQENSLDAVIIYETEGTRSNETDFKAFPTDVSSFTGLIRMSPNKLEDQIKIAAIFTSIDAGHILLEAYNDNVALNRDTYVKIHALNYSTQRSIRFGSRNGLVTDMLLILLISISFSSACGVITILALMLARYRIHAERVLTQKKNRLSEDELEVLNVVVYERNSVDSLHACAICLEDLKQGDKVRNLPCKHLFHTECVDGWFLKVHRSCPTCRQDVVPKKAIQKSKDITIESSPQATTQNNQPDIPRIETVNSNREQRGCHYANI